MFQSQPQGFCPGGSWAHLTLQLENIPAELLLDQCPQKLIQLLDFVLGRFSCSAFSWISFQGWETNPPQSVPETNTLFQRAWEPPAGAAVRATVALPTPLPPPLFDSDLRWRAE